MQRWFAAATAVLFLHLGTPDASGQTPAPGPTPAVGWRDGFFLQGDNGDYRLQLNFLVQADGRFTTGDDEGLLVDTFAIRRVRPIFQARLAQIFDFYLAPDFAGGAVNLRNAYAETRFSPALRIRFGKDKVPFGLERLHSAGYLLFVERALPTLVTPDRDLGIQALGELAGGIVTYAGGLFNGVVDGGSADTDTNDGKDLAGRVVVRPFARDPKHVAAGLGFALAGTRGSQTGALPSFRSASQQAFFAYDRDTLADGTRTRVSPQVFYYFKSFGGFAEYARSNNEVVRNGVPGEVAHAGWQVAGSLVVTGENATDRGVRAAAPFDPANGHWGALQIAARYHELTLDSDIDLGIIGSGERRTRAFTVGANWYLNPFVKWVINVERATFDRRVSATRRSESLILFRNQVSF